jgi:hypothetical protein
MSKPVYSPFVKTKRGEARALKELDTATKGAITPLFDVLALPSGVTADDEVEKHLAKQIRMIELAWSGQGACYVDLYDINPAVRTPNGVHPLVYVNAALEKVRIGYIPVAGLARDVNYLVALRGVLGGTTAALALRLELEDLLLPAGLSVRMKSLMRDIGAQALPIHVLIDCRSLVNRDMQGVKSAIRAALPEIRLLHPIRLVLCASGMVSDMSDYKKNSINRVKRRDLDMWMNIAQSVAPDLEYGDYGVIHPDYVDLDPKVIKPAAKIRYTTHGEWIIVKGTRWMDDTSQHHHLSADIAKCPEFRGADCWGGNYIETAAAGRLSYGSLETWVTVDQNAHITLTRKQVERVLMPLRQLGASATVQG